MEPSDTAIQEVIAEITAAENGKYPQELFVNARARTLEKFVEAARNCQDVLKSQAWSAVYRALVN